MASSQKPWKSWWPVTTSPFLSNTWASYKYSSSGSWRQTQHLIIKSQYHHITNSSARTCGKDYTLIQGENPNTAVHTGMRAPASRWQLATCLKGTGRWGRSARFFLSIQCDLHNTFLLEMLQHPSLLLIVVPTLMISTSIKQTRKPCLPQEGPWGFNTGLLVLLDSISETPLTRSGQSEYEVIFPANMRFPVGHTSKERPKEKKKGCSYWKFNQTLKSQPHLLSPRHLAIQIRA